MVLKKQVTAVLSLVCFFVLLFGFTAMAQNDEMQVGGTLDGRMLFLVETESQLRSIGTGKYGLDLAYMMSKDIALTEEWIPVSSKETPFTGVFWGNGCTITNLKITDPNAMVAGLFGYANGASIYNVTFADIDINSAGSNVAEKYINASCAVPKDCNIYDIFIK